MEKCIFTRKSVRRFLDKQLPSDIVQRIIEAGTYAPSACNL
ncbi:MAG: nitroreductase family protein [Bacteroidales bacterium]|nr:nitroreductase family protein [Bacteroidales bacterium]